MSDIFAITYDRAAAATQADGTAPSAADPAGPFAGIMNTGTSAACKITTKRGQAVTIWMVQGLIYPIETQNVWSTGGLSTVIGFGCPAVKSNGL